MMFALPRIGSVALAAIALPSIATASGVKREAWDVPGLAQPAEIVVDRWGLAHIYAKTERDAYFLQGYNAARDRLWQIDLWPCCTIRAAIARRRLRCFLR